MLEKQIYYDVRIKKDDNPEKDYLVRMKIHEHFVDAIVSSEQLIADKGYTVYKTRNKD